MDKATKKEILMVSGILGCALIVFELIGRGLAYLVRFFYSSGLLTRTFNTSCLFQITYTLTAILLPFFIASKLIEKRQNRTHSQLLPFGPPKNYILFLCSLGVGFMAIMLSNMLTSMFVVSMNHHGITFDSASVDVPTSASGYFWIIIADALVPALCEEYALRGVVMGSLRKYGDSAAIGFSSLLFALLPFGPPKNYILFLCSLGVGFMAIMLSNMLTSMFVVSMNHHGITFDSASVDVPTSASGYFWIIIADALVPALCEEYALRGVVMGSLRKYGDSAAIGFSSLLFALMHGNMTQAPFAFLLGLVIGRLVIATNSMWTGIIIHFLNNLFAVIMTIVSKNGSDMTTAVITIIAVTVALAMGLISVFILRSVYHWGDVETLNNPGSTAKEKRVNRWSAELYTIISLPMTVSLVWLFWQLFLTVHRG